MHTVIERDPVEVMSSDKNGLSGSGNGERSIQTGMLGQRVIHPGYCCEFFKESGFDWSPLSYPIVDIGGVQGNKMPEGLFVRSCQKNKPGSGQQSGHRDVHFRNPEAGVESAGKIPVGDMTGEGFTVEKKGCSLSQRPESHVGADAIRKMHRMVSDGIFFASLPKKNGQGTGQADCILLDFPDPGKKVGTGFRYLAPGHHEIAGGAVRQESVGERKDVRADLDLPVVIEQPENSCPMVVKHLSNRDPSRRRVEVCVGDNSHRRNVRIFRRKKIGTDNWAPAFVYSR